MSWMTFLVRVGIFLVIILVGFLLGPIIRGMITRMSRNTQDKGVYTFLGSFANNGIKVLAFVIGLSAIGANTNVLVGALSALGVGLSLALKNNMANVASGMQILLTRPFKVGDYVSVAAATGTYEGFCTAIDIMYTSLLTYDNTEVIVPNSTMIESVVTNYSNKKYRRMVITIPAAVDCDTRVICDKLVELTRSRANVLQDPPVSCSLTGYNETGTAAILKLYAYATFDNYWNVLYDLNDVIQANRKELHLLQPAQSLQIMKQEEGPAPE